MLVYENFYFKNLIWFYSSRKEIYFIVFILVFNFKILYINFFIYCCLKLKGNENGK